jgi:hypothetical protein
MMNELTNEEKNIVVSILNQVSVPIAQAMIVLTIIDKLEQQLSEK